MKVVIIEDEPLMADELSAEILKVDPNISITGRFESIKETLAFLGKSDLPDFLFSR